MKYLKYIKATLITGCFISLLTSCKKDFFEIPDPSGFEVVGSFEDEGAINLFLNRTYNLVMPQWPGTSSIHNTSDEMNGGVTSFLYGQLVENSVTDLGSAAGITSNRYSDIRRCNVALEGLSTSGLPENTRNALKGQFFFLRAYVYFRMVRLYGGVPLVLKAQGMGEEDLSTPRAKTSECIAAIAKDLDSAVAYLPAKWTGSDVGKVTRGAAAAVKGKALLYWASPQFNPNNIASRWTDAYAACKAAYDLCLADNYALLPSYANIWLTEDNNEILLVRKYNTSKDLGHNNENVARPYSESTAGSGSYQPTWNLVKSYPAANGLPITNPASGYDSVQYWLNRDPRFEATIAYNGDIWALSGKAGRKQWTYVGVPDETSSSIVTGFYCKKLCNPAITPAAAVYNSNTGGGNGMDWIEMRFAEVILNYAECANETGNLTQAKDLVRLIRQRAGIVAGAYDYGLAVATNTATMRSLILNERQVEFAFEGMRNYDLRRTRNLNLITARLSYREAPKLPYTAGTGTTAGRIYLDQVNSTGLKNRDTANLNNKAVYSAMFTPVGATSIEGANVINIPDKYYVYPLPNAFTLTPVIQQTIGWAGGTFNPYE